MTTVNLTVLKIHGKWTVRLQDKRGIQYLGETHSRGAIEAFTARLMTDSTTEGQTPILKMEPSPPTARAPALSTYPPHQGYLDGQKVVIA